MNRIWSLSLAVIPCLLSTVACTQSPDAQVGTLELRANGEDFIRQGFTSKDGWQIEFDHAYASIQDVIAYQAEPSFNPDTDVEIAAKTTVLLAESAKVDLAEGDENAATLQQVATMLCPGNWLQTLGQRWNSKGQQPVMVKRFRLKLP